MAKMHNPPHPGSLLKAVIADKGMTVGAFAAHIGVSRVALSRVLNARANLTAILDGHQDGHQGSESISFPLT